MRLQVEQGCRGSEVGYPACDFNFILTITEVINITISSLRSVFGSVCQFLVPKYFVQNVEFLSVVNLLERNI